MEPKNIINWFEIPVTNMERACSFYQALLGIELQTAPMGPLLMSFFPLPDGGKVSGALVLHEYYQPSQSGTLVYLNCNPRMDENLLRVESAGGQILQPKTIISDDNGYMAVILDTEGNRVALHSMA